MPELPVGHVPMVPDDLPHVLWRHVLLLRIHKAKLPLLGIALGLQLLPLASWKGGRRGLSINPCPLQGELGKVLLLKPWRAICNECLSVQEGNPPRV